MSLPSLCCCKPDKCTLLFADNFNAELPLLNGSLSQWDVVANIDVIGQPLIGAPVFDLLPGNGLYVDMAGTVGDATPPGVIYSRPYFTLTPGLDYILQVDLAGNQRQDLAGYGITLGVVVENVGWIQAWHVTIDDWLQLFTHYQFSFTADTPYLATLGAALDAGPIGRTPFYGLLLDNVKFWECPHGMLP